MAFVLPGGTLLDEGVMRGSIPRRTLNKKMKTILDLCGGTGSWSRPYREAGYNVKNITLPEYNVLFTKIKDDEIIFRKDTNDNYRLKVFKKDIYGILAAPFCTMFSIARTKAKKPRDLAEGFRTVRACLNIIWSCMEIKQETKKKTLPLKFWALENPNGMLKYFLGKPAFEFDPYEFGDGYKKRTYLWGWFNEPIKKIGKIKVEAPYHSLNPEKMKKFDKLASRAINPEMFGKLTRQERRAITPKGFAEAFFEVNQ